VYQYEDLRGGMPALNFKGEGLYAMMNIPFGCIEVSSPTTVSDLRGDRSTAFKESRLIDAQMTNHLHGLVKVFGSNGNFEEGRQPSRNNSRCEHSSG